MKLMKYDDSERVWAVLVAPNVDPEFGIHLGPPDLSGVIQDKDLLRQLYTLLVDAGLYDADRLLGKRKVLLSILKKLKLEHLLRDIIRAYQLDYYGEQNG